MAYSRSPINTCGSFNTGQKSALLKTLDEVQTEIDAGGAFVPTTASAALTDSSGGTATNTLAAITITAPADLAAVGVQLGIIRNAVASLAAKVNALRFELITSGILTT